MKLINDIIIEDLKESLGLNFLPKEDSHKILTDVLSLISKRAGMRIVEDLNEQELDEFEKIPKDDFEEMEKFLMSKNPKTKNIFDEEVDKVKKEMLSFKKEK
ncbi:MAG: DUF5663 domain-containing protein [Patescibacteria group bacterium]|nr:DUF5663 domain-containing protein [Patescibacteria group bacterium]